MSIVGARLQRVLFHADRVTGERWRQVRQRLGFERPPIVLPVDGWVTEGHAVVRARVIEAPLQVQLPAISGVPGSGRVRQLMQRLHALYARYATVDAPKVLVEVACGSRHTEALSDPEEYVEAKLPISAAVAPLSARVTVKRNGATAVVPIYAKKNRTKYLLVSDIDDTVLETELSNPLRRFAQLLLSDQPTRVPFPGVGELYQAMTRAGAAVFYVSNSPTNLHEHLSALFEQHDLPPGPLFLRDWGIHEHSVVPFSGGGRHKETALARIAEEFPKLPFVLVGDTSRQDADHYLNLAKSFPGRVKCIYLKRATGPLSWGVDEQDLQQRAEQAGVELLIVDTAAEVADHACSSKLIDREDLRAVRDAMVDDAAQPDAALELVSASA